MSVKPSTQLWIVNVVSFLLFAVLGATGLVNWLLLPRGREAADGFLIALRHLLRGIHEWAALAFIVVMLIHMALHWGYIRRHLKQMNLLG